MARGPGLTRWRATATRLRTLLVGDRLGLAILLGTLCFAGLYWRAGMFISDNATLVRTLSALADGHLWIEPATGEFFDAPGTVVRDGLVYGRNYGQLVLALPVLWLLQAVTAVANLHVALLAAWHLALLWFATVVGGLLGRERLARLVGAGAVGVSFLLNVALVEQFSDPSVPLIALQVTTLLAAGLGATLLYRLLSWRHDRRLGVLAGTAVVAVSPVGFWATIPKRHVTVAALTLAILYLFARSRAGEERFASVPGAGPVPVRRLSMYGCVAALAWIHAAEGLFLFLTVVAFDLPTAPANDRRTLAVLGVAFALAMLPVVLTNLLVAGDPVVPPRGLYAEGLAADLSGAGDAGTTAGGETGTDGGDGIVGVALGAVTRAVGEVIGTVGAVVGVVDRLVLSGALGYVGTFVLGIVTGGLDALGDVEALSRAFLRSDPAAVDEDLRFSGVNLAVLESMPLLAAGVAATAKLRADRQLRLSTRLRGLAATDGLAVAICVALALIYLNRLPLRVQVNARYLLPVYPLALYLLARTGVVRTLVSHALRPLLWSYGLGSLIGTQLLAAYVAGIGLQAGEAARLHALVGLAAAVLLAGTFTGYMYTPDERLRTAAAAALGLSAAVGTAFLLLSGLDYFSFVQNYVLPVAGAVSGALA